MRFGRRAGRFLRFLRECRGHRELGYARLREYIAERLGIGLRTAQELMRVDEALETLPLAAAAFEAHEITEGHLRLLTRVADPGTEAHWVSLARDMSVRELARVVTAARRPAREPARAEAADRAPAREPVCVVTATRTPARAVAPEAGDRGAGSAVPESDGSDARSAPDPEGCVTPPRGDPLEPEPPLERLSIAAPAWVATLWRETLPIVRRLAGGDLAPGACLDLILAETSPDLGADGQEARAAIEGSHPAVGSQTSLSRSPLPAQPPRIIDAELKRLLADEQRRQAELAERLRLTAADRGYLGAGFASLEEYARDRLGLAPRTLYHLLALGRALSALPPLRRAFLSGRLTGRQAVLLAGVATSRTAEAWLDRARRVTLRRLEDEVNVWTHLRETRPEVWSLLDGGPLPDGLGLAPGQPVRLHASAPPEPWSDTGACDRKDEIQLHASARPEAESGASPGRTQEWTRLHASAPPEPWSDTGACDRKDEIQLHASAPFGSDDGAASLRPGISAERFLEALEKHAVATPLPERLCTIRLLVDAEVAHAWRHTVERLRSDVRPDLTEWEALAILLREFLLVWDTSETRRQRREHPTLERDGWRCTAPGCRAMGTGRLHEHHIVFRSRGGAEADPANLTTLCIAHHRMLHDGLIRCTGEAPGRLRWEMGLEREASPFLVFVGETRVGGVAP